MNILIDKLRLGNEFANAIQAIYTEQRASIVVNNDLSKSIKIQKGTRQGCPLSPQYHGTGNATKRCSK